MIFCTFYFSLRLHTINGWPCFSSITIIYHVFRIFSEIITFNHLKRGKVGGLRHATLSLRRPSPAHRSLGPANGTGVRPRPVPSSPSPGLTPGTQLPLSARQQWRLRNLLKIPPEKSNGMGGDRTRNLTATSQSP